MGEPVVLGQVGVRQMLLQRPRPQDDTDQLQSHGHKQVTHDGCLCL